MFWLFPNICEIPKVPNHVLHREEWSWLGLYAVVSSNEIDTSEATRYSRKKRQTVNFPSFCTGDTVLGIWEGLSFGFFWVSPEYCQEHAMFFFLNFSLLLPNDFVFAFPAVMFWVLPCSRKYGTEHSFQFLQHSALTLSRSKKRCNSQQESKELICPSKIQLVGF